MTAIGLTWPAPAQAVNKCVLGGKVTYQDSPCEEKRETVAQGLVKQERIAAIHRKLDSLAALGHGMVQPPPPPPQSPAATHGSDGDSGNFVPRPKSRDAEQSRQARVSANLQEQTERKNAESAGALTRLLDGVNEACGGRPVDFPSVGMSDEVFRNCTLHARFGGVTQVVVSEDGKVPLRLYVFPTQRASRVYSIGGVVTAIRP